MIRYLVYLLTPYLSTHAAYQHEGWYSNVQEAFVPVSSVLKTSIEISGDGSTAVTENGEVVEWTSEDNYMFRLTAFREPLLDWLFRRPSPISPKNRLNEVGVRVHVYNCLPNPIWQVIALVESGLRDVSVSRPAARVSWGISVPGLCQSLHQKVHDAFRMGQETLNMLFTCGLMLWQIILLWSMTNSSTCVC
jgi:methionyl-tRNA synthetase